MGAAGRGEGIDYCKKRDVSENLKVKTERVQLAFSGGFAKLRKVSVGLLCRSVRPHGKTRLFWIDFHEIPYFIIFRKFLEKIKVPLRSVKNTGYFTFMLPFIAS